METKPAVNPANAANKPVRKRIPLSTPQRKLEVPDIEGFHLYWFLDVNVPRAIQGGYDFVNATEVVINLFSVGTNSSVSGNADLGSHVKIIAGTGSDGKPEHLNLMKIREEWWKEDQKVLEERNASIMSAIFKEDQIMGGGQQSAGDQKQQYVKKALFNRPSRK